MVPNLEGGSVALQERECPLVHVLRETEVSEDIGRPFWVDVVKEARDVEQEEGSHIVYGPCGLDPMNQSCDGVHRTVS